LGCPTLPQGAEQKAVRDFDRRARLQVYQRVT
jgi:hypothetical protein